MLAYLSEERGYRSLAAHACEATFARSKYHFGARSHLAFAPRAVDDRAPAQSDPLLRMENQEHNQGIAYQLA